MEDKTAEKAADQALVERVQKGDKRAFDVLVLKYQQRVINIVMPYVKDYNHAQDISQEAFIKAYRALANFRGDSAFYTWLYRIAINTAKNHLLSLSRRPPSSDVEADKAIQLDAGERLKERATPENDLMQLEIATTVRDTINALPDELRIAITLREMEGLSYEAIAQSMDCPIGTVRSRIFRAREAIDTKLRPLIED